MWKQVVVVVALTLETVLGGQGLCGSNVTTTKALQAFDTGPNACPTEELTTRISADWVSCCDSQGGQCRDLVGQADLPCVNDTRTLEITVNFTNTSHTKPTAGDCCRTCSMYGDPEGISFFMGRDKWIPCDARDPVHCGIRKDICEALDDPNMHKCGWQRGQKKNNKGWDVGLLGSPCQPRLDLGDVTMNMLTVPGLIKVDLFLGERGIISKTVLEFSGGPTLTVDAENCFKAGKDLPFRSRANLTRNDPDIKVYQLDFRDVGFRVACLRHHSGGKYGDVRLNIQDLSIRNTMVPFATGFCANGTIADKTGNHSHSGPIHEACVQNTTDPLRACKEIVSNWASLNEIQECAITFCLDSYVSDRDECRRELGRASTYDNVKNSRDGFRAAERLWLHYYCESLYNQGVISNKNACENLVSKEGYHWAITTWGMGRRIYNSLYRTPQFPCGSSLSEYRVDVINHRPCDQGVYIDARMDDDEWTSLYFIPEWKPLCHDTIIVYPRDDIRLFSFPIRLRQCDDRDQCMFDTFAKCNSVIGVQAEMVFTRSTTTSDIYNKFLEGTLVCNPPDPETGSTTWCIN